MSGSSVQIQRTKSIVLYHVCSACKNPVIRPCTVHTFLVSNITGFQEKKNARKAEASAQEQLDALIAKIVSCKREPKGLGMLAQAPSQNAWSGIELRTDVDDRTKATTWISGMLGSCPCCGQLELWQGNATPKMMADVPPESFPMVFNDYNRATLEAMLQLQNQAEENEAIRNDPVRFAQAKEENSRLLLERDREEATLRSTALSEQISQLEKEKATLEQDLKGAGVFAIKAKKEITGHINQVVEQIRTLQAQDKARLKDSADAIRRYTLDLERLSLILSPDEVNAEVIVSNEAEAFRLFVDKAE